MVRKIAAEIPTETLQKDMEMFRKSALDLGATDAKIITTDKVIIDERVRAKCMNPKCPLYGTNGNCPPHTPDIDMVRRIVQNYRYGIFVITKYPGNLFPNNFNDSPVGKDKFGSHKLITRLETEAFRAGYHLATGLADGPCKTRYCPDQECSVLTGQGCRMGLRARYSMESWGMDAYLMAARAEWEVYPIGVHTCTKDVPHRVALGLVLIY